MAGVLNLVPRASNRSVEDDMALRRLAVQLSAQLPESTDDAIAALDYAKILVRSFLADVPPLD